MKMFKKKDGFTLVELIVVIAILAILAGVAIPAYSGYISKANDASVVTDLDAIQTAAQAANATKGEITKITVSADGKTITVYASAFADKYDDDFKTYYTAATPGTDGTGTQVFTMTAAVKNWESSSYKSGATWVKADDSTNSLKAGWNAKLVTG